MMPQIEPMLYFDPQTRSPAAFCSRCKGELYRPGDRCLRCQRNSL